MNTRQRQMSTLTDSTSTHKPSTYMVKTGLGAALPPPLRKWVTLDRKPRCFRAVLLLSRKRSGLSGGARVIPLPAGQETNRSV